MPAKRRGSPLLVAAVCLVSVFGSRPRLPDFSGGLTINALAFFPAPWAPFSGVGGVRFEELAAVHKSGVDEQRLQQLESLVAEVKASHFSHLVGQQRNFGDHPGVSAGQEVTYLHQHAPESLLTLLWELALAAGAGMTAWELSKRTAHLRRPALRCLEAIEYQPKSNHASDARKQSSAANLDSALGWHHDGATLCTMVVALSSAGEDFDGGEIQVRDQRGDDEVLHTVDDLRRGDVVAWRGWDSHRVCPVRSGKRRVLVAEWWHGPSCSESDERPQDTEESVRQLLQEDGTCAQLHVLLAQVSLAKGETEIAESSCRAAIQLDPWLVEAHNELGLVLAQQGNIIGAEMSFRAALRLDDQQPQIHYHIGKCLRARGHISGAEESFRAALDLAPSTPELQEALNDTLSMKQELASA